VQVDVQQANIERQQSDINSQKVQLENDALIAKRTAAQFDKGLVSPQENETAQLAVKVRQANIDSLEKQLVQAKANLQQAKLNVSYCTITSPVDGVVVNRLVDIGQTVQASMQTPQFFTIATDLTELKLTASVDEADIGFLRPNMPVTFTVDAYGQKVFQGTVDAVRLNATMTNNVVTYPVWINVKNPNLELRPSMTANMRIIVDQAANVTKVPNQALRFRPTTDMYAWLGMTPPAAGRGRDVNANAAKVDQEPIAAKVAAKTSNVTGRSAAPKIDDLFESVPKRVQPGQVWIYDEKSADPNKKLRSIGVRLGLSDGQFSELISSAEPLAVGTSVVTGVVPPASALPKPGQNNIFQQNRGGFGGPGFGPGGPGGPGGGGPPRGVGR
jgi:RND family efflux transporter MFP subunit